MPARRDFTPEELAARFERRREQNRQAQRRFRARHADEVSLTNREVSATPLPSDSSLPLSSTNSTPPPVARLAERLVAFGRGYKHDAARLAKLVADFPQLDVEEEVADALDWLERPANKKRLLNLRFLRRWCEKSEASRVLAAQLTDRPPWATRREVLLPGGSYAPPAAFQKNPGPEGLPVLNGPLERIPTEEVRRAMAEAATVPLGVKLARVKERTR